MLLAEHFLQKYVKENNKKIVRISTLAIDLLNSYHWPGNVREIQNCMERADLEVRARRRSATTKERVDAHGRGLRRRRHLHPRAVDRRREITAADRGVHEPRLRVLRGRDREHALSPERFDGNFGQTNYVAAKAGVIGMTHVWARELGRYNITANAVAPGFIATDMTKSMPEKILDMMVSRIPARRIGQPEDVASAFLFLASEEAGYINGAVLSVDGGMVTGT